MKDYGMLVIAGTVAYFGVIFIYTRLVSCKRHNHKVASIAASEHYYKVELPLSKKKDK